jgi:hypothetical protein
VQTEGRALCLLHFCYIPFNRKRCFLATVATGELYAAGGTPALQTDIPPLTALENSSTHHVTFCALKQLKRTFYYVSGSGVALYASVRTV